jgi:hypothetical protein
VLHEVVLVDRSFQRNGKLVVGFVGSPLSQ